MIRKIKNTIVLSLMLVLTLSIGVNQTAAQESGVSVKGVVIESGTGLPMQYVSVSVVSTGKSTSTGEDGTFAIQVPDLNAELIIQYPDFITRQVFINGRERIEISLVANVYKTLDKTFSKPLKNSVLKNEVYAVSAISADEISKTNATSFDQTLQGLVPGLNVTQQSGLPGQKTWMTMRGVSSLFCKNQPLVMIDGMVHDYNYANNGVMEGFSLNPFDIIDVDDISDISVMRNGDSYLGSLSSNGMIYINTEQKSEASTVIRASAYTGISVAPRNLKVMDADQFTNYFKSYLTAAGLNEEGISTLLPWMIGEGNDKYKYGNQTNWQKEIYNPAVLQKYHMFLKGGDDIATYNISVGYLNHEGTIKNTGFNRFNLRVNGKINISDKFSIIPNVKLSLSDTYVPNMGPTVQRNPLIAALQKSPLMAPYAKDVLSGQDLPYLDGEGIFGVSNPVTLVDVATGTNRNYHFLSSINANYQFNSKLSMSYLIGINFNNARESIFIPDGGVVQIDLAANSPQEFMNEFRSTQHNAVLNYVDKFSNGNSLNIQAGARYMQNSYMYSTLIDLNTASDDFKRLGDGSTFSYLRESFGDNRTLNWGAVYVNGVYSIQDKYIVNANLAYDANSVINPNNRTTIYPSVGAAWRLSSEEFLAGQSAIEDLKLRASYSVTGNVYSSVYDFSNLYYTEKRLNETGTITREAVPNQNLDVEKNSIINLGLDFTGKQQLLNAHIDIYYSAVNNLIIEQKLPQAFGYTQYYDNGGQLANVGAELAVDYRKNFNEITLLVGGNASTNLSVVNALDFIADDQSNIITSVPGAEYITEKGGVVNAFYGYKTNGVFQSDDEAGGLIGPNGGEAQAGDVRFVDVDSDGFITDKDKQVIGNPNAALFGGFFSSVKYKNWEVTARFNYSVGNDVYNYVRVQTEGMSSFANQLTSVTNRWTADQSSATMPRAAYGDPVGNSVFSDRWIEDGSYLKLKHLTVNYTLPNTGWVQGVDVYCTMSNLLTLTGYSGYDPEFYYLNSPFYMGIDYGKMPKSPSFILGVKIDL